jgi:hypothetical protein
MGKRIVVGTACARASAVLCVGIALFSGDALAQKLELPPEIAVSETPAGTGIIKKKSVANIPIWKRITTGTYHGVNHIRIAFDDARMRIGDSADEILGRPAFPFSKTETQLDLVVLTAADLGFREGYTSLAEIYRRAIELGLKLCPAEVGPQLRLQYVDQPVGEFLHIAMHPVAAYHGDLVDLTVANGGTGLLLLGGDGSPELKLHSTVKFVFVRPSQVASETPQAGPFGSGIGDLHDGAAGVSPSD